MALFRCKMCGGTLEITDQSVAVCEYCGTKQTLPKLADDKKATLYDRANHFRRNNEFDKAMALYEQILNEDPQDSESYWSIVLCRYGIEYVEDPVSHKRVPTVNRAQYTSIFADVDYKNALKYADDYQRSIYEEEAQAIDDIQKGILAISAQEEPFDVFICYKETDMAGRRAPDSVYAQEIYNALTKEGYKVFFSRITLEDKLGSAYEPYIFSALNSAKVMIVVGTKAEHFNAVWVKNEWSRYLALIRAGEKKTLIPAYRDMSPYDLPEEFAYLQAQDMGKIGYVQDIVHGVQKLLKKEEPKPTGTVVAANTVDDTTYVKRAFLYLEDGNAKSAKEYCEKALEINPENAEAYLCLLMIDLNIKQRSHLANSKESYENNGNYEKAVRFASPELQNELKGYAQSVREKHGEEIYNNALKLMESKKLADYQQALNLFESISKWKDVKANIEECKANIDKLQKAAAKAKRTKLIAIIMTVVFAVLGIGGYTVYTTKIIPSKNYNAAVEIYNEAMTANTSSHTGLVISRSFKDAYVELEKLNGYGDSEELMDNIVTKWQSYVLSNPDFLGVFAETVVLPEKNMKGFYDGLVDSIDIIAKKYGVYTDILTSEARLNDYIDALKMLPEDYEKSADLIKFFEIANKREYIHDYKDIAQAKTLLKSLWEYDFIKGIVRSDGVITDFLVGEWTTSDGQYITFYENSDGSTSCQYNLPWVEQPIGTKYYDIKDSTYIFIDENHNELAKVYRFDITGVDTMNVFCYKDNRTYRVTRK